MNSHDRRAQLARAVRRQKNRCYWCRTRFGALSATRDHVHPRSRGGSDQRGNVVAACLPCNRLLGDLPAHVRLRWRELVAA